MCIELVDEKNPTGLWIRSHGLRNVSRKIGFSAGIANRRVDDFSCRDF
jgi:hypothetical protein